MAHNPTWHAEYVALENAEAEARAIYRAAKAAHARARTEVSQAVRAVEILAALEAFRAAGKARWEFEMEGAQIVDVATLSAPEFVRALMPFQQEG